VYVNTSRCQVGRHLPKLFDSLARLKFEDDDDDSSKVNLRQGSDTTMSDSDVKVAVGMWSKDGEYVTMPELCDCSGQVQYISCFILLDTCTRSYLQ